MFLRVISRHDGGASKGTGYRESGRAGALAQRHRARVLRPVWRDPRIHYALNCASIGCPNLAGRAYTRDHPERLLEESARDYVNHPRGAAWQDGELRASSIYDWYQGDFGGTEARGHLLRYAQPELAERLRGAMGGDRL
jgi:hypothetical protein